VGAIVGKILDFWSGRELRPDPPNRIDQVSRTQLCRIAAFSEALGVLTPDDLQRFVQEHLPEDPELHCHPFELTGEQAYRLVGVLHTSARRVGMFAKGWQQVRVFCRTRCTCSMVAPAWIQLTGAGAAAQSAREGAPTAIVKQHPRLPLSAGEP
jgi:hypothetical protein